MKRLLFPVLMVIAFSAMAQTTPKFVYTEASDLTLTGKLMNTPNPYHRVDTVKFKGFTKSENNQVRNSAGIGVAFRTNSPTISILTKYGDVGRPNNTGGFSARGYDLYIRENGKWVWAGAGVSGDLEQPFNLISGMLNIIELLINLFNGQRQLFLGFMGFFNALGMLLKIIACIFQSLVLTGNGNFLLMHGIRDLSDFSFDRIFALLKFAKFGLVSIVRCSAFFDFGFQILDFSFTAKQVGHF